MNEESLQITGHFFDGLSSRPHRVVVTAGADGLRIAFSDATPAQAERAYAKDQVEIGTRLGNTPRSLSFNDGAKVESADNDTIDRLAAVWGARASTVHRLESNWRVVIGAVALIALLAWSGFVWGVPWAATRVAMALPDKMAEHIGKGTLAALDKLLFEPSTVKSERRKAVEQSFTSLASAYPELSLRLNFRKLGVPNAFALPDGTVVVTDELIEIAKTDDEVLGVLAHEIGHVKHRHALRMTLEASAVGLFSTVAFGDAAQASALFAGLPSFYANAQYSQVKESEADGFAIVLMQRLGLRPAALADILERMTEERGDTEREIPQYFSSHPSTQSRMARLRAASAGGSAR